METPTTKLMTAIFKIVHYNTMRASMTPEETQLHQNLSERFGCLKCMNIIKGKDGETILLIKSKTHRMLGVVITEQGLIFSKEQYYVPLNNSLFPIEEALANPRLYVVVPELVSPDCAHMLVFKELQMLKECFMSFTPDAKEYVL